MIELPASRTVDQFRRWLVYIAMGPYATQASIQEEIDMPPEQRICAHGFRVAPRVPWGQCPYEKSVQ